MQDLTSDDILGKEVVDPEGDILGITMKLHLDIVSRKILGVTVDQGVWKADLFVGIDFIEQFGEDVIFLNRIPYSKWVGYSVYSANGSRLGKVVDVEWSEKGWTKLALACPRPGKPWKKEIREIYPRDIEIAGHSIILKEQDPKRP